MAQRAIDVGLPHLLVGGRRGQPEGVVVGRTVSVRSVPTRTGEWAEQSRKAEPAGRSRSRQAKRPGPSSPLTADPGGRTVGETHQPPHRRSGPWLKLPRRAIRPAPDPSGPPGVASGGTFGRSGSRGPDPSRAFGSASTTPASGVRVTRPHPSRPPVRPDRHLIRGEPPPGSTERLARTPGSDRRTRATARPQGTGRCASTSGSGDAVASTAASVAEGGVHRAEEGVAGGEAAGVLGNTGREQGDGHRGGVADVRGDQAVGQAPQGMPVR